MGFLIYDRHACMKQPFHLVLVGTKTLHTRTRARNRNIIPPHLYLWIQLLFFNKWKLNQKLRELRVNLFSDGSRWILLLGWCNPARNNIVGINLEIDNKVLVEKIHVHDNNSIHKIEWCQNSCTIAEILSGWFGFISAGIIIQCRVHVYASRTVTLTVALGSMEGALNISPLKYYNTTANESKPLFIGTYIHEYCTTQGLKLTIFCHIYSRWVDH